MGLLQPRSRIPTGVEVAVVLPRAHVAALSQSGVIAV